MDVYKHTNYTFLPLHTSARVSTNLLAEKTSDLHQITLLRDVRLLAIVC